ncbi:MAG TPA: hypothetical protein VKA84_29155, partial [Gemmatimonadaceae bacterium]|nr:hypothetical protein [Gemmatimonadaceae bacterium]
METSDDRESGTPPASTAPATAASATAGSAARRPDVVYTLPHDWAAIRQFLAPALERIDPAAEGTQVVIVTPDDETTLAVADAALA